MSESRDGQEFTITDFDSLTLQKTSLRTADEWLNYLRENNAFPSPEIEAIVSTLNIESLCNSNRGVAFLHGKLFDGKRLFPFSTAAEASIRGFQIPGAEIVCVLFELILLHPELISMFEYFIVIGEEFEDENGLFYLMVSSNSGKPEICKYYCEPVAGCFANISDAYIFET